MQLKTPPDSRASIDKRPLSNTKRYTFLVALSLTLCACLPLQKQTAPSQEGKQTVVGGQLTSNDDTDSQHLCAPPWNNTLNDTPTNFSLPKLTLWDRMRDNYQFRPILKISRQQVNIHRAWFRKHPEYIKRVIERGKNYLHFIADEIERRGMPGELALLPIVESAFDPFAYSSWRASGMWQIIPSTGRSLGLKQTWWYDGRRDVYASTHAALDYLEQLHKRFDGDWLHALAAYNSGSGRVNRAIKQNKRDKRSTNFWYLELPHETRHYVPKLLALSHIFDEPESYGIELPFLANEPAFAVVNIDSQIDLAQASEMAEIDIDQLYQLNPGFNRWATDPGGPHRLLLPINKEMVFERNLAELPKKERVTWRRHKIRQGETLSHISKRYNISVDTLKTVNNIDNASIRAGKTMMVPSASKEANYYSQSIDERLRKVQNKPKKGKQKIKYAVKAGDTLWSIARKYKIDSSKIARWNNMSKRDTLNIGQKLVLWVTNAQGEHSIIRKVAYKVRTGDSLSKIAYKFRVQVNDIKKWNQLDAQKYLKPGQALVLFVDVKS